jgi:hypothetical protein
MMPPMDITNSSRASVRRFIKEGFSAIDVAEAFVSFDADQPANRVEAFMRQQDFDFIGVRHDGAVVGYARRDELTSGTCSDHILYFGTDQLVQDDTPLHDITALLDATDCLFLATLGTVGGIITRSDLEKPPVRMWLFGMLTMIEYLFTDIIRETYPRNRWRDQLPGSRLAKAQALKNERRRRKQRIDLLNCLTFADKGHILFRDERIRAQFGFESRSTARETMRNIERLRNSLAHAHPIIAESWPTIVQLARNVDTVLQLLDFRGVPPAAERARRDRERASRTAEQ